MNISRDVLYDFKSAKIQKISNDGKLHITDNLCSKNLDILLRILNLNNKDLLTDKSIEFNKFISISNEIKSKRTLF